MILKGQQCAQCYKVIHYVFVPLWQRMFTWRGGHWLIRIAEPALRFQSFPCIAHDRKLGILDVGGEAGGPFRFGIRLFILSCCNRLYIPVIIFTRAHTIFWRSFDKDNDSIHDFWTYQSGLRVDTRRWISNFATVHCRLASA